MVDDRPATLDDVLLQHEVERTLFREAAFLDAHDYTAWLDLLTEDVTYWVPVRSTRAADDAAREFSLAGEAAFFDDDRAMLELRAAKRQSGYAWSEDPPSRTRHCITNVRVVDRRGDEVTVNANMIVYRSRLDVDVDWWVGRRVDRLRLVNGRWKIARREVYLDQTVLTSKNLSTFL